MFPQPLGPLGGGNMEKYCEIWGNEMLHRMTGPHRQGPWPSGKGKYGEIWRNLGK